MVIVPTEKRFDWQHAPVVLALLVLVNVGVFYLYQSGDTAKLERALSAYQEQDLLRTEWPLYRDYLDDPERQEELDYYRELMDMGMEPAVAQGIVVDLEFREHLAAVADRAIEDPAGWRRARRIVDEQIKSVSAVAGGLIPSRLQPANLFSSQFLHGDILHLLGNMVFLVVCGFAVEAAVGHVRFLLFYLLTGAAGGLLHVWVAGGHAPLIGASGSVSGVMAMYLMLFRLRRIEFFYWILFFVGYFRAPALLILPVYVGKELLDYYLGDASNVAFMAHVGGFAGGALLMGLALLLPGRNVNQDYLDEEPDRDPVRERLASIQNSIERLDFVTALKRLNALIRDEGRRVDWLYLRSALVMALRPELYEKSLLDVLGSRALTEQDAERQARIWEVHPELRGRVRSEALLDLGLSWCDTGQDGTAEALFAFMESGQSRARDLGRLANKLAATAGSQDGGQDKQARYRKLAQHYLQGAEG